MRRPTEHPPSPSNECLLLLAEVARSSTRRKVMPYLARSVSLDSRVQTPHILRCSCTSLQLQHASRYRNLGWLMGLESTTLAATSRCADQRSTRHRRATNACCFWLRWRDRPRDVRLCRVLHDLFPSTLGCKRHTSCAAVAHPCNCSTHRVTDQRSTRHRRTWGG